MEFSELREGDRVWLRRVPFRVASVDASEAILDGYLHLRAHPSGALFVLPGVRSGGGRRRRDDGVKLALTLADVQVAGAEQVSTAV